MRIDLQKCEASTVQYQNQFTGAQRREFSGMILWLTNNNPSNPQQPIHSLRKTHQ